MPRAVTIGRKIGVKMSRAGAMSMKVPTISRKIFNIRRMTYLLLEMPSTMWLMASGSPVKDMTKESTEEAPIISMTIVVMRPVSMRIPGMSDRL